jgi:hypothetical protein
MLTIEDIRSALHAGDTRKDYWMFRCIWENILAEDAAEYFVSVFGEVAEKRYALYAHDSNINLLSRMVSGASYGNSEDSYKVPNEYLYTPTIEEQVNYITICRQHALNILKANPSHIHPSVNLEKLIEKTNMDVAVTITDLQIHNSFNHLNVAIDPRIVIPMKMIVAKYANMVLEAYNAANSPIQNGHEFSGIATSIMAWQHKQLHYMFNRKAIHSMIARVSDQLVLGLYETQAPVRDSNSRYLEEFNVSDVFDSGDTSNHLLSAAYNFAQRHDQALKKRMEEIIETREDMARAARLVELLDKLCGRLDDRRALMTRVHFNERGEPQIDPADEKLKNFLENHKNYKKTHEYIFKSEFNSEVTEPDNRLFKGLVSREVTGSITIEGDFSNLTNIPFNNEPAKLAPYKREDWINFRLPPTLQAIRRGGISIPSSESFYLSRYFYPDSDKNLPEPSPLLIRSVGQDFWGVDISSEGNDNEDDNESGED